MAIPDRFLDELVARSDIVDVVSEYVHLTRKGNRYWACCPFHSEKTPSFSVLPDRQIYKCFGCGKGGGVINFVMEAANLPFPDAVELLARRAGMEMPEMERSGPDLRGRRRQLRELNRRAARLFHQWLYAPEGQAGLEYLHRRGLTKRTITRFGLGFAPDSWDALLRTLTAEGVTKRDLLDAGLAVNNKDGRIYDRFRNRVMFPIIDVQGDVIGFGGRVMDDSTPKYLNSPETLIYNKSRNMFALNMAKKSKAGRVILTEGYMDTIALHQAGFDCAVASLGTSLTEEHGQLLSRFFKDVIISYDGDSAGVKAAQRAIPILEKAGLRVRVLQVTGAKDPDEYIRSYGRDAFARLLDQSENQVDYRLQQIQKKYNMAEDAQRVAFLQEAAQLLAGLSSEVERDIYSGHAAQMADIGKDVMVREVEQVFRRRRSRAQKQAERRAMNPQTQMQPDSWNLHYTNLRSAPAEEGILHLAMLDSSLIRKMDGLTGAEFSSPVLGRVFDMVRTRAEQGLSTQPAVLAGQLNPEEMDLICRIAVRPTTLANSDQAIRDYLTAIRREAILRDTGDPDAMLLAMQQKLRAKKAYSDDPA